MELKFPKESDYESYEEYEKAVVSYDRTMLGYIDSCYENHLLEKYGQ